MKNGSFEKAIEMARKAGAYEALLGFISNNIGKGAGLNLDYIKEIIDETLGNDYSKGEGVKDD